MKEEIKEVNVTFVTGSIYKKEYLESLLGLKIKNHKVDLDEIQDLDLNKVVEHKVRQAYEILKTPVLVEDVGLEFTEMGKLPGAFMKFFLTELSMQQICDLIKGEDRSATARCVFGYFDGKDLKLFESSMKGTILRSPDSSDGGYGWDKIFMPDGYRVARSKLSKEDDHKTYLQVKPIEKVRQFLLNLK